jgi:hypothetical protein
VSAQEFSISVEAQNPKQQKEIMSTIAKLQKEFSELHIKVDTESKELVPEEVLMIILVSVASEVLTKIVLGFLDKLWNDLKNKGISPTLSSLESIQGKAEKYLFDIGVVDFKIVKRESRGLYVFFLFKSKNASHRLYISSSDKRIIKYEKV